METKYRDSLIMEPTFRTFISFEGIDNCGKTTQIQRLLHQLAQHQIFPQVVREPGGTTISEAIRSILLNPDFTEMHAHTEILLYSAARAQLVHQHLIPQLQAGTYFIADRFFDSTTAYQGYGRGIDLTIVQTLNHFATGGLVPYKTILIDISPQVAMERQKGRRDRLEEGGVAFFQRVREGFLHIARQEPQRFVVINGEQSEEAIAREVWEIISDIWLAV